MGITGDENRLDAVTISDSANLASRIENLTKYYGTTILLSESCLKKLENQGVFNFRYLGKVMVKGKQEATRIYECVDGDEIQTRSVKIASLAIFEIEINGYFKQEFEAAANAFESVVLQNREDKPAKLFLDKSKWLRKVGVPEDWTGIELMGKK